MIFVTLGTHELPFNRLLDALEDLELSDEVLIQHGNTPHSSTRYRCVPFLTAEQFDNAMEQSDLVITHGGVGSILSALEKGKRVIAVPRLSRYGEHNDDHQTEICEQMDREGYLATCSDVDRLGEAIEESHIKEYLPYPFDNSALLAAVKNVLDS